jgi:hypothetical protein
MLALDYFNYKPPPPPPLPPCQICGEFFPYCIKGIFCIAKYGISAKKLVNIREGAELQFT